jgi:hypothetical protein
MPSVFDQSYFKQTVHDCSYSKLDLLLEGVQKKLDIPIEPGRSAKIHAKCGYWENANSNL